jgi:hypothetical protein
LGRQPMAMQCTRFCNFGKGMCFRFFVESNFLLRMNF